MIKKRRERVLRSDVKIMDQRPVLHPIVVQIPRREGTSRQQAMSLPRTGSRAGLCKLGGFRYVWIPATNVGIFMREID